MSFKTARTSGSTPSSDSNLHDHSVPCIYKGDHLIIREHSSSSNEKRVVLCVYCPQQNIKKTFDLYHSNQEARLRGNCLTEVETDQYYSKTTTGVEKVAAAALLLLKIQKS